MYGALEGIAIHNVQHERGNREGVQLGTSLLMDVSYIAWSRNMPPGPLDARLSNVA